MGEEYPKGAVMLVGRGFLREAASPPPLLLSFCVKNYILEKDSIEGPRPTGVMVPSGYSGVILLAHIPGHIPFRPLRFEIGPQIGSSGPSPLPHFTSPKDISRSRRGVLIIKHGSRLL
jgi:hypothetical protein